MDYAPVNSDLESSFDVLTEESTYAGAFGLVAGAFIGGLLTYLPFQRLGPWLTSVEPHSPHLPVDTSSLTPVPALLHTVRL